MPTVPFDGRRPHAALAAGPIGLELTVSEASDDVREDAAVAEYSRSRGCRADGGRTLVVGPDGHPGLAVRGPRSRTPRGPSGRATRGSRRRRTGAGGCPSSAGSSGGSARSSRRSRRARRAAAGPWPPSRATSPSRTPCRRARRAACPRRGSARDASKIVISSPDGTCTVQVPSEPGTSRLRRRTLANVPRTITSWLPRRGAVRVEVARLDAVLDEVAPGRRVDPDRAGRRDVVGRDRVAERDEAARARDVADRRRARARARRSTAAGARRSSRPPRRRGRRRALAGCARPRRR